MPVFHVEMRWRCSACDSENLGRHKICQNCSKPKDREPFYDAPETAQPSPEQALTDAALIARATAGADWCCRYCGTHQPRNTGECRNCGAPEEEASQAAAFTAQATPAAAPAPEVQPRARFRRWYVVVAAAGAFLGLLFLVFRTREVSGTVVERSWQHVAVVERYQIIPGEGFAESRPGGAFDVVEAGRRHHHNDRVQDGTQRESYSERVACGEDCSTSSVHCSTNDNGFKTCSGGDRVCRTRYCSETRYREVPRYKDVPVYQTWYRWRAWQWNVHRSLVEKGSDEPPHWPSDARIQLGVGCGPGEQERVRREATYAVVFEDDDHERRAYRPRDLTEFSRFARSSRWKLRVGRARETEVVAPE